MQSCSVITNKNYLSNYYSIEEQECWFEVENNWPKSRCGILSVPEDYQNPNGSYIQLPYVIFSPIGKISKPPVLIAGGGGPGYGLGYSTKSSDSAGEDLFSYWYTSVIDNNRELILFDNRGVGSSIPKLDCPEVVEASLVSLEKGLQNDENITFISEAYARCKNRLEALDINLNHFNVINAARDIEMLRLALGYEKLSIAGQSYGTRVALVYENYFSNHLETLILDGVYPEFTKYYDEVNRIDDQVFGNIFYKCIEDKQCSEKHPNNFKGRFVEYLEQLKIKPILITLEIWNREGFYDVYVTPNVLMSAIWNRLYFKDAVYELPDIIESIIQGDRITLVELIKYDYVDLITDYFDEGGYVSYNCFDEVAFTDFDKALAESKNNSLTKYVNVDHLKLEKSVCDVWDIKPASPEFKQTRKISVPMLIFSGEYDPTTPPEWGEQLEKLSKKAWHYIWPDEGHIILTGFDCPSEIAKSFLNQPEISPFFHECLFTE